MAAKVASFGTGGTSATGVDSRVGAPEADEEFAAPIDWQEMSRRYESPSLADYLPSKEMLENVDAAQTESAIGHWKMAYAQMLGKLVLPPNTPGRQGKVPKGLLVRKYNTKEMGWFLTTPNVKSYEEQLVAAQRIWGETARFSFTLPCAFIPPIAGPGGTKVDCQGVFETKWYAPVSPDWDGCQAKDVPAERNSVLHGAPGTMEVTRNWTADMHLAESGQVDEFHLIPAPPTVYTVNAGKTVACAAEPHWDAGAPGVTSISIGPGERMEQVGPRVWCSSAQGQRYQMEVRWQDKTCWVETFAVTKVPAP